MRTPSTRKITAVFSAREAMEGAGVLLHRGFGQPQIPLFDPFLLFDDFSSPNPKDYLPGFPWHPHRGIETVTYLLRGSVRHRDSIGNSGVIGAGDVQWMNAGSGIIHEEMPEGGAGIQGFQLWVNLPAEKKMLPPSYQGVSVGDVPVIARGDSATVRLIAGSLGDARGPVQDIALTPLYIDVSILPGGCFELPIAEGHTVFCYVCDGALGVSLASEMSCGGSIILFERLGDHVSLCAGTSGARFLLASGQPIGEPISWGGPIVMNTQEELETAFRELRDGTFIKQ